MTTQASPSIHHPQHNASPADEGHRPASAHTDARLHPANSDQEPLRTWRKIKRCTEGVQDVKGKSRSAPDGTSYLQSKLTRLRVVQLQATSSTGKSTRCQEGQLVKGCVELDICGSFMLGTNGRTRGTRRVALDESPCIRSLPTTVQCCDITIYLMTPTPLDALSMLKPVPPSMC